jgi:hypothetical protein
MMARGYKRREPRHPNQGLAVALDHMVLSKSRRRKDSIIIERTTVRQIPNGEPVTEVEEIEMRVGDSIVSDFSDYRMKKVRRGADMAEEFDPATLTRTRITMTYKGLRS